MNTGRRTHKPHHLLYNKTSLAGLIIGCSGLACAVLLLLIDMMSAQENPYLGILTFMISPAVTITGLVITTVGAIRMRKRLHRRELIGESMPIVDLNNPAHFRTVVFSVTGGLLFIGMSALGAYRAYHFTESVTFCGVTCHKVMKPEHTAFGVSPHANVSCTTCHIGPGAGWFVKSKLNGLKQVWNTAMDLYPRPIPAPVHNLRPAKETCYTCHWPEKFFGSVLLSRTYYRASEKKNDPWTIDMLVHVGGGDTRHGRGEGIHWHMAVNNRVEYVPADEKRLEIPWVRQTHPDGSATIYRTTDTNYASFLKGIATTAAVARAGLRTMDCIDCHNRPTHQYHSPERAVNESMRAGRIDATLPNIKSLAVNALDGDYASEAEGVAAIEAAIREEFADPDPRVDEAVRQVQKIYRENFFPDMKVNWRVYPDHIGHMITPGCFRCHDGKHVSDDGRMIRRDCNICHTIIAQGSGTQLDTISMGGLEFEHPEDVGDSWETQRCDECHDGMPIL